MQGWFCLFLFMITNASSFWSNLSTYCFRVESTDSRRMWVYDVRYSIKMCILLVHVRLWISKATPFITVFQSTSSFSHSFIQVMVDIWYLCSAQAF